MSITKQKSSGAYYTPEFIVKYILNSVLDNHNLSDVRLIDPSVGSGNFLFPAIQYIHKTTSKPISDIINDNIFGIDIDADVLSKLKENLSSPNLFHGNSTDKQFLAPHLEKYDFVIGNPPYVRILNIPQEEQSFLKDWEHSKGSLDLYVPFIELGMSLLKPNGTLAYIVSNGYLKNKSSVRLLNWLFENQYITEIADFGQHYLFPEASTYTSILICKKCKNSELRIRLPRECFGEKLKNGMLDIDANMTSETKPYPINRSTFLVSKNNEAFIEACENQKYKLKDAVRISVGLATLADDVFFLNNPDGIEPEILRPCIKVSRLKNEDGIKNNKCKIIFPYHIEKNQIIPWTEDELKGCPSAYAYLQMHYERLAARDKGKSVKYAWFHYGRSQGLRTLLGRKILIPPMMKEMRFILCKQEDLLYLSGYAIFQKNPELDLNIIKIVLESSVFEKYLNIKGKGYQGGWKATNKNQICDFSIPEFNEKEREIILNLPKEQSSLLIGSKYGLQ